MAGKTGDLLNMFGDKNAAIKDEKTIYEHFKDNPEYLKDMEALIEN